jgi:hypothetical protein
MAEEWSPALFLFGVGNEKSTGCILGKSCGHTLYWGLGDRYDTGDISNLSQGRFQMKKGQNILKSRILLTP